MSDSYEQYTREELMRLLRERDRQPRFGLVWERDQIEHERALNDDFVALELDPAQSAGVAPYRNLLLEADNFDALRYLRMTHAGRIKCIYIDPPYNTGNRDFIYNDRFVDKDDAWKHSKWLEFMYRRLLLARDLLREDGVILISINDENRSKLELLLEQVFPGQRIGSFVWRTRDSTSAKGRNFSDVHEHILIYGGKEFSFFGAAKTQKKYKNPDNDPRGLWNGDPLTLAFNRFERANLFYPLQNPKTGRWYPCDSNRVWAYATETRVSNTQSLQAETMEEFIRQDKIIFPVPEQERVVTWQSMSELLKAIDEQDVPVTPKRKIPLLTRDTPDLEFWVDKPIGFGRPLFKKFWTELKSHFNPVSSWIARLTEDVDDEDFVTLRSKQAGEGTETITAIFGYKAFNYPKPPSLIKNLLRHSSQDDDIVLDFFAGSGTTAQAVLELNQEDESSRRFILVSSTEQTQKEPDKNVCRDVCARRIDGVIKGYHGVPGTGGDFAYLRVQRLATERLYNELAHPQVWLALQLIHLDGLAAFDPAAEIQAAALEDGWLIYVPKLTDAALAQIEQQAEQGGTLVLYSWQPGLLRQRLPLANATYEAIPQFLLERFGGAV